MEPPPPILHQPITVPQATTPPSEPLPPSRALPGLENFRVVDTPQDRNTRKELFRFLAVVAMLATLALGQHWLRARRKYNRDMNRYLTVARQVLGVCLSAAPPYLERSPALFSRGYDRVEIWGDLYSVRWDDPAQHYFASGEVDFFLPGQKDPHPAELRCTVVETPPQAALALREVWIGAPQPP